MNRGRLVSLVWVLYGATQLYWQWVRSVDYTDARVVLYVASCGLIGAGGLAGTIDPDRFVPDYTPNWVIVTQILALAGVAVGGFLMWG